MTETSMPTIVAAWLVAGHVNTLWSQWADNVGDEAGCCTECCAPCGALKALLDTGQLDKLYGVYADTSGGEPSPWDAEKRQVGREWLNEAWSARVGCHDGEEKSCST